MTVTFGIDVGGTRVKAGVLAGNNEPLHRHVEPTAPLQDMRAFEAQLERIVAELVKRGGARPDAIGLSLSGPVDPRRGCVYLPGKIKGLDRHPTVPFLRERFGVPVIADNDGRLACYGEWQVGAGKGVDNLVVFTLGTGIGSGVVLDGRLLTDRHFQRGTQCGHGVIDVNGPLCLTGARGTGESLASVTALVQQMRDHLARGIPSVLDPLPPEQIDFIKIAEAVRGKDRLSREVFERWLDRFAVVLLNAFYAYTPDLILLGGGPAAAADLFLPRLKAWLEAHAFRFPPERPIEIHAASLGGDAGWIGAALLAKNSASR